MTKYRQFDQEFHAGFDAGADGLNRAPRSDRASIIIDDTILAAIREKVLHDAAFRKFSMLDESGLNNLLGLTFDQALKSYPNLLRVMGDVLKQVSSSLQDMVRENNTQETVDHGIEFSLLLKKYGQWCFLNGYFAEALQSFHAALSFLPDDPEIYEAMGDIYCSADNHEQAMLYYEDAMRYGSTDGVLRKLVYAKVKTADGIMVEDAAVAYQLYTDALEYVHNYVPALCGIGYCCFLEEDYESAQIYFSRVIDIDPSCVRALVGLGNVRLALYDEAAAESLYREAVLKDQDFVPALEAMANLYFSYYGNVPRALEYLQKAVDCEPRNVDLLYFMARVLIAHGEPDQAEMVLKNILEIQSDHKDAFDLYAYLVNGEHDGTYIPDSSVTPIKPERFEVSRDFYFSLQRISAPEDKVLLSTYAQKVVHDHDFRLTMGDDDPFREN